MMEKQVDQLVEAAEDCGRYATTSALHIKAVFTRNRTRRQIIDHHDELVAALKNMSTLMNTEVHYIHNCQPGLNEPPTTEQCTTLLGQMEQGVRDSQALLAKLEE